MSVGNLEFNYLYFPIPKCGSTSVLNVLLKQFNGVIYGLDKYATEYPYEFEGNYTFTVVRNPYDRAVSIWWHFVYSSLAYRYKYLKIVGPKLKEFFFFLNWLKGRKDRLNRIAWTGCKFLRDMPITEIIKLEEIDERFPLDAVLPKLNKSTRKVTAMYLTPPIKSLIYEIYAEDFERFDYDK